MNIAIFGTKKEARYFCSILKKQRNHRIETFVDNDKSKQGTYIDDIIVKSFDEIENDLTIDAIIIAVRGQLSRLTIYEQVKKSEKKIGYFKLSVFERDEAPDNLDDVVFWVDENDKPVISYLEYNVTDSCNLKCKGCSHFSNLVSEDCHSDIKDFVADLKRLNEVAQILQLRLLGGEPLLHPQIKQFVKCAREILPKADIVIVSNGLLIPKIDKELFGMMKSNKVGFHITSYIPTMRLKEKIDEVVGEYDIPIYYSPESIEQFAKSLSMTGMSDPVKSQSVCMASGCRFLRKGRLYKCPVEGLIDIFAEKYGYDIPRDRGVDIYCDSDYSKVLLDMLEPTEMCRFCSEKLEWYDWKVENNPVKSDWLLAN